MQMKEDKDKTRGKKTKFDFNEETGEMFDKEFDDFDVLVNSEYLGNNEEFLEE